LTIKKFNLEFAIDPLFKKTMAGFDENDAQSLLLNQLSVNADGKIIFDASDAKLDNNRMTAETIEEDDNEAKIDNPEILLGIFIFLIIGV
jgi:condensin complex subunit 2